MKFLTSLVAAIALSACAPATLDGPPGRAAPIEVELPAMKTFARSAATAPSRSNSQIARDFLDLSFQLESGRELPVFSRFEKPVTVRVVGNPPPTLPGDLSKLLARLRSEARIDIKQVSDGDASITVEVIARNELQRLVPQAACFVVPRVGSWAEFRRARRSQATDWSTLSARDRVSVFLPGDVSPQEVRDCLHEEIAQALGPLNDLYRLPDSVFNDDNFHTVLTGFDMLILRAYYAPELKSGMSKSQVAAQLPSILGRINPAGRSNAIAPEDPVSRQWVEAIETALGPKASNARRKSSANRALEIAQSAGWSDTRRAFSHFAVGRLYLGTNAELALANFLIADRIYASLNDTDLHRAHLAVHLAAFSLSSGQGADTLNTVNPQLSIAVKSENAALLATLLMMKAEALGLENRPSEAKEVRENSLGWARYGFGSDENVRARIDEIGALKPVQQGSNS